MVLHPLHNTTSCSHSQQHWRSSCPPAGVGRSRASARRAPPDCAAARWSQAAGGAQATVQADSYEEVVDALAARALAAAQQLPPGRMHLVGIAGSPGSGKSTLASLVAGRITSLAAQQGTLTRGAAVAPMDGFHLYKAQLDAMPDPQEAYARRGAPWTFDAAAFVAAVRRLREHGAAVLPSFDHGVGDPVPEDIAIDSTRHAVVLVEGNYLLLDEQPWLQLRELLDDAWFCDTPLDEAMGRVFERQTAIGVPPEVSRVRIATNDRPNAVLVNASQHAARVLVPSSTPFAAAEEEKRR